MKTTNDVSDLEYGALKKIPGWLGFLDYEMMRCLVSLQNDFTQGAVAEIGVHHGKSFVPLARFSGTRKLYVIDIFEDQEKNIDQSGCGSRTEFVSNLKRFDIDMGRVTIDQRVSSEVTANDIVNKVGKVAFFHIDGGHHLDAVSADIKLACDVADDDTILVIDDVFRPEWPEVSMAAFNSRHLIEYGFQLFAIGFNKSFFCRADQVGKYQSLLRGNEILECYFNKTYRVFDREILVYQYYPLPEWRFRTIIIWCLSVWQPKIYVALKRFLAW